MEECTGLESGCQLSFLFLFFVVAVFVVCGGGGDGGDVVGDGAYFTANLGHFPWENVVGFFPRESKLQESGGTQPNKPWTYIYI